MFLKTAVRVVVVGGYIAVVATQFLKGMHALYALNPEAFYCLVLGGVFLLVSYGLREELTS